MSDECALPAELIRPILQHIEDAEPLALLCLSSKLLQSEAQRTLYHFPTHFKLRPIQHIRLLTSLLHNSQLASLVKTYHVPSIMGRQKATAWTLLRSVLPMMINLKEFLIIAFSEDINVLPMDRIFCQLERLTWIQVDSEPPGIFPRWLETQKALKKLKWICRSSIEISPSAVPNLVSLEGNFHVISALLPGRHITRLHWIADLTLKGCSLQEILKDVSPELRKLESLSFETNFNALNYHSVVDHLTSLTSLQVIGDDKEFINNIQIPPNLHVLKLTMQHGYGKNAVFSTAQRSTFIEALFAKSSALLRVDIAEKLVGGDVFYERWEQGVRREGFVSSKDVVRA